MFLLVTMKTSIIVLSSSFNNSDELISEDVVLIVGANSCSVKDSCCCGVKVSRCGCCCASSEHGNGSIDLVVKKSDSKFLDAVIDSIKCSSGDPSNLQIGSLSDYEPFPSYNFAYLLENSDYQTYFKKDHIVKPHFSLPYKPPKNIS